MRRYVFCFCFCFRQVAWLRVFGDFFFLVDRRLFSYYSGDHGCMCGGGGEVRYSLFYSTSCLVWTGEVV